MVCDLIDRFELCHYDLHLLAHVSDFKKRQSGTDQPTRQPGALASTRANPILSKEVEDMLRPNLSFPHGQVLKAGHLIPLPTLHSRHSGGSVKARRFDQ